jgi:hypothetical protein
MILMPSQARREPVCFEMAELFLNGSRGAAHSEDLIKQDLLALRNPAMLQRRLATIDKAHDFRRIYIMGCGRSGTWLLAGLFSTYSNLEFIPRELSIEHFGLFTTTKKILLLKRDHAAHTRIEKIPECIEIAYIMRHPFDVLTSHIPPNNKIYHIDPYRWLNEMLSLQYLLDSKRKHTTIIKYEDLVQDPHKSQSLIAGKLNLSISHPVEMLDKVFQVHDAVASAMHGLRPIDTSSIGKYKKNPEKIAYLKSIRPRLGRLLKWVGEEYGYDVSI